MRETRADTRVAVVAAIALHALLFALMFAGMWWTRTAAPVSAAGPVIEADLVDPNALSAPLRRALDAPATIPEPEPEPVIEPKPEPEQPPVPEVIPEPEPPPPETQPQPQEQLPVPDTREQERVEREAEAVRQAAREQEEKRRQEQIDLTERKRQQEAERKQREIARKLEAIRAEQARNKRETELAEQKLRQIEDAKARSEAAAASSAAPPPGNEGVDTNLAARYKAALVRAITSNWTRPETVPLGQICIINIRQVVGGTVIEAKVDPSCPYDELGRRSIEAAVLKAQPLPYAGFESVFNRSLRLNFEAADR